MNSLGRILEFGYYSILLYSIFNSILNKEKKKSIEEASAAIFSDDLMVEIVSWLPVKYVMQLRCVNKFFNTLVFDPHFIQMHLSKSTQNLQLSFTSFENNSADFTKSEDWDSRWITLSIPDLLLQNTVTISHLSDSYYRLSRSPHYRWVIGSCNGLLCVYGNSWPDQYLYFWNPAMRKESKRIPLFFDIYINRNFDFSFGYDNSTQTYKVVAFYVELNSDSNPKSVVKVFSLGDNSWRDVQCLPLVPLYCLLGINDFHNEGMHFNGTINWFALDDINLDRSAAALDRCVILSLDLSTETYTKLLLPRGLDKVPAGYPPNLVVLMDCLGFCHDFDKTHFVIWQMKDFGVQESWLQLFKISYENFARENLLPLYLSENGDTLVLGNDRHREAFIYNCRDNKVEKIKIADRTNWELGNYYVESLVSTD
ncbi:F-box/kelch-repeat protein At3g06240-like [Trifolium pratense]|nr:F-box/kelch-repeat protein At3g06240-like [Trifolium pratense]